MLETGETAATAAARQAAKLRRSAHKLDGRRLGRNLFDAVRYQLARLWTIVVAELHVRPRHQRDRNQAVIERFGRYRLGQIFVDAKFDRLDDAPAFAMMR